ncbi:hypothetical protein J9317_18760 [Metabacillus sp. KIGAM252]|uniref:Uncharacterized protein n=2 Tax=Metabacillus flavus TaxID=2823519 RepID=A0ABS5LKA0_9BACI|nr:hypothetical protein [Metabacillus flavus]
MTAKKVMQQLTYLELIDIEEHDSTWLQVFESKLKEFRRIDSKATYTKSVSDLENNTILWIENTLSFLKEKKEWLIVVPKCPEPVWANVQVLDYTKAIGELWNTSESNSFLIADKSTGTVVQMFFEEQCYEIHVGKCDITNVKENI